MLGELPLIRVRYVPHCLAHGIPGSWDGMRPGRRNGKAVGWERTMDEVEAAVCAMPHEDRADRSLESADDADPASIGSTDAFPEVAFAPIRRFPYETSEHWLWTILRRLPSPFFEAITRTRYDCSSRKGGLMTSTFIGL